MDCFVATRLAMTLLDRNMTSPARGIICPKFCTNLVPRKEGAGDTGCALHPRSRVQYARVERTRAYRFSGNTPASPAQWLYGLWRALLGDEFVLSPSPAD